MSLPWGVKVDVDADNSQLVADYVESLKDKTLALPSANEVSFLKAEVKSRKGKYALILRYEIIKRPATLSTISRL